MNFNIFNSIILAGIIQGLIFGLIVIFSKKYRSYSTIVLSAFILSFSLDNFQYYLEDAGVISEEFLMSVVFIPFQFLSGPLFLLYALSLLGNGSKFRKSYRWFFLPFVLALLTSTVYKLAYVMDFHNPATDFLLMHMENWFEYLSILLDFSILGYVAYRMNRFEKREAIEANSRLAWFKFVIISLFALSLIWIYIMIEDYFYDTEYWYALYIGMSVIIYWMGHIGIYKFGIEEQRKKIRSFSIENKSTYPQVKQKNEHISTLEKLLVNQRKFLDPTLTLDKIADEMNLSKSHLSRIINAELGMGFPDYLNSLRVEEAKSYLMNPDFANYTLVAIGLEAGFNSKTTFNTAFKKLTSLTPSEYRESQQ